MGELHPQQVNHSHWAALTWTGFLSLNVSKVSLEPVSHPSLGLGIGADSAGSVLQTGNRRPRSWGFEAQAMSVPGWAHATYLPQQVWRH